jgi:hypothetical protein
MKSSARSLNQRTISGMESLNPGYNNNDRSINDDHTKRQQLQQMSAENN